jgi:hypothetical protein
VKNLQKKTACDHDWKKIGGLLEQGLFQDVTTQLKTIHVLDDLWLLLEAYIGLGNYNEIKKLLEYWKYNISNFIQESYFLYYEAKTKINEKLYEEADSILDEALEKANDENIREKIKKTKIQLEREI